MIGGRIFGLFVIGGLGTEGWGVFLELVGLGLEFKF